MPECQAGEDCECLWKKMIGKPYSGKPNIWFDVACDGEVLQVIFVVTRHSLTLLQQRIVHRYKKVRSSYVVNISSPTAVVRLKNSN
jgi:hypothetical protein